MISRGLNCAASGLIAAVLLLAGTGASAQERKERLDLDKIPQPVMAALKAKFPKAEIDTWSREKEGDDIVYDIEFKQEGRKGEADIKENGAYVNYEKEVAAEDLPDAVRKAVDRKYPKATLKEIMEITAVTGKAEELEGYEIILTTADKQDAEVTVAPGGQILEDSGTGEGHDSASLSASRGEHSCDASEHGGESYGEHEESGAQLALNQTYDKVRNGVRLILAYDPETNSFNGTVENTTNKTLKRVRVEVHLSNGFELGPTTPVDLDPGEKHAVTLTAKSKTFDRWTAHPEVGSAEHGGGDHQREHDQGER